MAGYCFNFHYMNRLAAVYNFTFRFAQSIFF